MTATNTPTHALVLAAATTACESSAIDVTRGATDAGRWSNAVGMDVRTLDAQRVPSDVVEPIALDVAAAHGDGDTTALPTVASVRGERWTFVASGTDADLRAVAATSLDDAWAVGPGVVEHWDGTAWRAVPVFDDWDLDAVWAAGAGDVWVGGVTAPGGQCVLARYDGATWTVAAGLPPGTITDLWGRGPADVWAAGRFAAPNAPVLHWTGGGWAGDASLARVLGPDAPSLDVVTAFDALGGTGAGGLRWARPTGGGLARWDGREWSEVPGGDDEGAPVHGGVWAASDDEAWAVTGGLVRVAGGVAQRVAWLGTPGSSGGGLAGVWGSSAGDVWAVGAALVHVDGAGPSLVTTALDHPPLLAVAGSGPDDVWAVGVHGTILHFGP